MKYSWCKCETRWRIVCWMTIDGKAKGIRSGYDICLVISTPTSHLPLDPEQRQGAVLRSLGDSSPARLPHSSKRQTQSRQGPLPVDPSASNNHSYQALVETPSTGARRGEAVQLRRHRKQRTTYGNLHQHAHCMATVHAPHPAKRAAQPIYGYPQQNYQNGLLQPGKIINVNSYTVTVERYLSQGS